jgi:outer membrane protein
VDLKALLAALMCLAAPAARAQFNNSQLGAGPAFNSVIGQGPQYGLFIEYGRYLESSFEFFARAPVLIVETPSGANTPTGQGRVFGTGLSLGVRYLFNEDTLRPWVGLQLTGSVLITQPQVAWFLGGGTSLGLDWVLSESFALGVRGSYDVFVELNQPWRHQVGVMLALHVLL